MQRKTWLVFAYCSVFALACGDVTSGDSDSSEDVEAASSGASQATYANASSALDAWKDEVWTRNFDPAYAHGEDVAVDAQRNVYVVGRVVGSFPGQIPSDPRSSDYFVRKYDPAGNAIWTRQINLSFKSDNTATAVVADGNFIYVAARSYERSYRRGGYGELRIQKLDRNGNEWWSKTHHFTDGGISLSGGMAVTGSRIYIGGSSGVTTDVVDPIVPRQAAVLALDTNRGTQVWVKNFGDSNARDAVIDVAADASGVYLTGWTDGTLAGQSSEGRRDIFVRKYDLAGNLVWTRQFGTDADDEPGGIALYNNALYVSGWSDTGGPPGPAGQEVGQRTGSARSYDLDGTLRWSEQLEGFLKSDASDIAVDATGVYVAGTSRPDAASDGSSDAGTIWKFDFDGATMGHVRTSYASRNNGKAIALDAGRIYLASSPRSAGTLTRFGAPGAPCTDLYDDLIVNSVQDAQRIERIFGCFNVHGGVYVQNAAGVRNLDFLSGLRWVGESVGISQNPDLQNLRGLENLQHVGDYLTIEGNPSLERINTFDSLVEVDGQINIFQNESLSRIKLDALDHTPRLLITANPALIDVNAPILDKVYGEIRIDNNIDLRRVKMPKLKRVGQLLVRYNREVQTLDFPELTRVDDIEITRLGLLELLDFPSLHIIDNELRITGNQLLRKIKAPMLTNIDARFRVETNAELISIEMDALEYVGIRSGPPTDIGLLIHDNISLTHFELPALHSVERSIGIIDNNGLIAISLPSLSSQGGLPIAPDDDVFVIADNESLQSLDLHRLQRTGAFRLYRNYQLTDITPFESAELEVNGNFMLSNNRALQSLDAFPATTVDGSFAVLANSTLPTCKAYEFLDRVTILPSPPDIAIGGNDDSNPGACP